MVFVKFGTRRIATGYDELFVSCPSCEHHAWADAMVYSIYYHFYGVPVFPIDKEVDLICQDCGLRRSGIPLTAKLVKDYPEVKGKFRHPWYTYAGFGFFCFIVVTIMVERIIR